MKGKGKLKEGKCKRITIRIGRNKFDKGIKWKEGRYERERKLK